MQYVQVEIIQRVRIHPLNPYAWKYGNIAKHAENIHYTVKRSKLEPDVTYFGAIGIESDFLYFLLF